MAGVAMGLVLEPNGEFVVLTDILGSEDSLGDMDFKVAGDEECITAFQMDIKVEGITLEILAKALEKAGAARRVVLERMRACAPAPRGELSPHAPRIRAMAVPVDKIGTLIGPGGRTARAIQSSTGVEVKVEPDGRVTLLGPDEAAVAQAFAMVEGLTSDPEVGRIYRASKVTGVAPFGAFVEVLPRREGLLHVSEWDVGRTESIADVAKEGDLVDVMVVEVQDGSGKIKLSRKAVLLADGKGQEAKQAKAPAGAEVKAAVAPSTPTGKRQLKVRITGE